MVTLFCAIVGVAGSAFPVDIDASQSVGHLKKAIKEEKKNDFKEVDADRLQLFLAKKTDGGAWLPDDDPAAQALNNGVTHSDVQVMIDGDEMMATKTLQHWLFDKNKMPQPSTNQIHVLVKLLPTQGAAALNVVALSLPPTTIQRHPECLKRGAAMPWELKEEEAYTREVKKARRDTDIAAATAAKKLMSKIDECNWDAIFAIESVVDLPFPSLLVQPNRFELDERGHFAYQARSQLKPLYDNVVSRWMKQRPITVNVAGTIGYGKSHMLAVLVLLLLKKPLQSEFGSKPFVCYIPDCGELLNGEFAIVNILKNNVLINMPEFIGPLDTITDVQAVLQSRQVILVADQWNVIDDGDLECQTARDLLGLCLGTSVAVTIQVKSINSKTWRARLPKQTSDDNNFYYGGFSTDEFGVWLDHHPAIFTEHDEELALLTGKVPLLLSVFARVYNEHDSWESIVQRVQQDAIVKDWKKLLTKFYEDIDGDQVWKVCTLSVDCEVQSSIVDFRFFYERSSLRLCATNEIVLRLLYQVWSKRSAADALLTRWRDFLSRALLTVNRSALGFTVEEITKAQICRQGVVGKYPLPNNWSIKRTRFDPGDEALMLGSVIKTRGTNSWWILLDPVIFNYAGVDMILVTDTELVGINVTIAKTHSSLDPFFNLWRELAESNNLAIKGLFVAPDNFVLQQDNIDVVFLRDVYHELWLAIENTTIQSRIKDSTCNCKTGCSSKRCGCKARGKLCNQSCGCQTCQNT